MSAPHLRADLAIVEQRFRNEQSFVVKDPSTHAYFRFQPVEMRVMRLFDGARSAAQIAEQLVADGVKVSAATVEGFARKLAALGLLERTLYERTTQQLERLRAERKRSRSVVRGELFRMRFPFGDPDAALNRWYPRLRWCFTPAFVVLSVALFLTYGAIILAQRETYAAELAASFSFGALTPWSLVVLLGTFTLLTAIHEFGHAFACKHFGGEVHEMGFMLLFFMPAFYANVSDAWSFRERRARLWVTAAGAWIELFVTSVLSMLWITLTPGSVIGQIAIAAMLIGGIANILTNSNPLLPLDGYFALGDWLEMSNLRQRARAHAAIWARRHLLRESIAVPALEPREHRILLAYGISAFAYTTAFLLFFASGVVGFVNGLLGATAAGLVALGVLLAMRKPLRAVAAAGRALWRTYTTRRTNRSRTRTSIIVAVALLLVAAIVPCHLTADGPFTVASSTQMVLTAPSSGVVHSVSVREGNVLAAGAPVLQLRDPTLDREQVTRQAMVDSLSAELTRADAGGASGAGEVLRANIDAATASASETRARVGDLRVTATIAGTVATPRPEQLTGRAVQIGDTLLTLTDVAQREAIIQLGGAGAMDVRVGQTVRYVGQQDVGQPMRGVISSVSPIGGSVGAVEARVQLSPGSTLRLGATGEARVLWRRTNVLGAIVWALRSALRNDLLL